MKTETKTNFDGVVQSDGQDYWECLVVVEEEEWIGEITVRLNRDTIVCQLMGTEDNAPLPFKTYAWVGKGNIDSEATIAAIKYVDWITAHCKL